MRVYKILEKLWKNGRNNIRRFLAERRVRHVRGNEKCEAPARTALRTS
jgi:hypothetical protein